MSEDGAAPIPSIEATDRFGQETIARVSVYELIRDQARRQPQAAFLHGMDRASLTYLSLSGQVDYVLRCFDACGISRSDKIALLLPDSPEMAVAAISVAAGSTCAPLNPRYCERELQRYLADLAPKAVITNAELGGRVVNLIRSLGISIIQLATDPQAPAGVFQLDIEEAACSNVKPSSTDDVALALHTSGTSGESKVVPLTHRNIISAANNIGEAVELTPQDRCLAVMPLHHIHGLSMLLSSLATGGSVICPGRFSVDSFLDCAEQFGATWYSAAPAIHRMILDHARREPSSAAAVSFRFIRSASAPMPPALIDDMERTFRTHFVEAYGMTEAGPQIASNRLPPAQRKRGSVGTPCGPDVSVISADGTERPRGCQGEIAIRGANVIQAYANPAHDDSFVGDLLRTGDLGYLDDDGYLFVTGRLKDVINCGGEKISPREVDEALLEHPAVAEAVTFSVPHDVLQESVAAAVVLKPGFDGPGDEQAFQLQLIQAIRTDVARRISSFKVPQQLVVLDALPKADGGKIRRSEMFALMHAVQQQSDTKHDRDSHADGVPVTNRLVDIWSDVLGVERPAIDQNFFALGGHSLTAAQMTVRVEEEFQVELSPETVFAAPTIKELSSHIRRANRATRARPAAESREVSCSPLCGEFPASFSQRRLWFLDQLEHSNAYNMSASLWLEGELDEQHVEDALNEIRRRHTTLRTTFRFSHGDLVQLVAASNAVPLEVVDLASHPMAQREVMARRLAAEELAQPYNLGVGPLFRAKLLRLSPTSHALILGMHHVISDGWSRRVLLRELAELMDAFENQRRPALPELKRPYVEYASSEREAARQGSQQPPIRYWCDKLRGAPQLLSLPTDRLRPVQRSHTGTTLRSRIPESTTRSLRQLALDEQATPYMTLLAAFQALLSRCSRQRSFVIGTPIANRPDTTAEKLIGFFANTLPIRVDLPRGITFRELLRQAKRNTLEAFGHQDFAFEDLIDKLNPKRTLSHHPLFQVMFAFQNVSTDPWEFDLSRKLRARPVETEKTTTKFDLTLYVNEYQDNLTTDWLYSTELFDAETIASWKNSFETMLIAIAQNPDATIEELPVGPESQDGEPQLFHRRFEEMAVQRPQSVAVQDGNQSLSYEEVNARANRLARRLQQIGAAPGSLVGVQLHRSPDWIVAVLGVLKAGGAYVPIDADYPSNRVRFILDDSKVAFVVTNSELARSIQSGVGDLESDTPQLVCLDGDDEAIQRQRTSNVDIARTRDDLAYVIYTSGSTGQPKGVKITHGNLASYLPTMREAVGIDENDTYLHTASFAFSSSVRQFALPLTVGATVVIASHQQIRDPEMLLAFARDKSVSIVDFVPSYFRSCVDMLKTLEIDVRELLLNNRIRKVLSASEPLRGEIVNAWYSELRQTAQVVNMFGQTETAGIVTVFPVHRQAAVDDDVLPIGRPIATATIQLLDDSGRPVPVGKVGEIYVGGATVGAGYINQPELTAKRFLPGPRHPSGQRKLYRTGDRGRIRSDGIIEFVGRADNQIKIRGHRVAPEEIEAAMRRHPAVREAAVVATSSTANPDADDRRQQRLFAFLVPHRTSNLEVPESSLCEAVRKHLAEQLPHYMVPAKIIQLERLPSNHNGKVDRPELMRMASAMRRTRPSADGSAEHILTAIWRNVLEVEHVGLDDNFFDLGGDSLLSIQVVQLAKQDRVDINLRQLFQHQTIRALAADLRAKQQGTSRQDDRKSTRQSDDTTDDRVLVSIDSLRAFGREALQQVGLAPEGAAIVTEVQLESSLRGQPTHNIGDIPRYARRFKAGILNPQPQFTQHRETRNSVVIDGDNGPGQWVATFAMETAIRKARGSGFSMVAVRRSNHFGAAGNYVRTAAVEGLIGICTTNGPLVLAPTGGVTPTFGNNPLAVGIPSESHFPIVLDMAMSVAPRGKIGLQLAEGRPLESGWILDSLGSPTTNLADLAAGLSAPIGGHKGYGLALVMEVLAGVLSGAGFCWDHQKHGESSAEGMDLGHLFIVIDPRVFMSAGEFKSRVDRLIEQTKSGQLDAECKEILIPGELEHRARENNLRHGVPIRKSTWKALTTYARQAGLGSELTRRI